MPKVGLFFYVNNIALIDSIDMSMAQNYGDFMISFASHYDIWNSQYENIYKKPYDFYPRGRVVYNVKNNEFIIYTDKCINGDGIKKIIKAFDIEDENLQIMSDEHYVCKKCNRNYCE